MRLILLIVTFILSSSVWADVGRLSLEKYLDEVKAENPQARAIVSNIEAYRAQVHQAEVVLSPEGYAEYSRFDDRKPQLSYAIGPVRTNGYSWKAGVQKQTTVGLTGNLFYESYHAQLFGATPTFNQFFQINPYTQNRAVLELKQSLLRNGLGEAVKADQEAARAKAQSDLYSEQYKLRDLMMQAENAYWTMVSLDQIIDLQKLNVDRAKKTYEWMDRRTRMRLFDDVDSIQAKNAYESRQLELQQSLDDRADLARAFNTLRGRDSEDVEKLHTPPTDEWMKLDEKQKGLVRSDFKSAQELANAQRAKAISANSQIKPQLDIIGNVATAGLQNSFQLANQDVKNWNHPSWSLGVSFRVPLNFSLTKDLTVGNKAAMMAADDLEKNIKFNQERVLQDLIKKKQEAQVRYQKALRIETLQGEMVKKEHQRLLNGRTTTFQSLNFEQNLALAQIQRVRAQLVLLQIHNTLKTFEVQ